MESEVHPAWRSDEFVRVREAAEWLNMNPCTYYKKAKAGILPKPVKMGRSARILASELIAFKERIVSARNGIAA